MITIEKLKQLQSLQDELDYHIISICNQLSNELYDDADIILYNVKKYFEHYFICCYGTKNCLGKTENLVEIYPVELFINSTNQQILDYIDKRRRESKQLQEQEEKKELCRLKEKYPDV